MGSLNKSKRSSSITACGENDEKSQARLAKILLDKPAPRVTAQAWVIVNQK
jgi:hypothetical protein